MTRLLWDRIRAIPVSTLSWHDERTGRPMSWEYILIGVLAAAAIFVLVKRGGG